MKYLFVKFVYLKVRKVFTSGCYIVQMSFLLIAAYVTHSPVLLIASLTIAVASGGFSACK